MSDPGNPQYDAECVTYKDPDSHYTGSEICFGYNENTLTIVDFTDEAMTQAR